MRGDDVTVVRVLRADRTVVTVTGRGDELTRQRLTTVAQDPCWDVHRTPDDSVRRAAEALTPYSSW